jgi:hypothetical protein
MNMVVVSGFLLAFFDVLGMSWGQIVVLPYSFAIGCAIGWLLVSKTTSTPAKSIACLALLPVYSFDPLWLYANFFGPRMDKIHVWDGAALAEVGLSQVHYGIPILRSLWFTATIVICAISYWVYRNDKKASGEQLVVGGEGRSGIQEP